MNKEEIKLFEELYEKFQKRCKQVAKIFAKYNCDYKDEYIRNDWSLDYDKSYINVSAYNEAKIFCYGCDVDTVSLHFPIELLSFTDDQIEQYAKDKYGGKKNE